MKRSAAVITADWINSSAYTKKQWEKILAEEKKLLDNLRTRKGSRLDYEIKRGDYLQILTQEPAESLELALLLKACVNRIDENGQVPEVQSKKPVSDMRISIGIGDVSTRSKSLAESNGSAFQFSGRALDEMKHSQRLLKISSGNEEFNREMDVHLQLLEMIMQRWSIASAEIIYHYFQGVQRQVDLAEKLQITQTSVSRRMNVLGMDALLNLTQRFRESVANL